LLSRYTGQSDIVVGIPSLGRDTPELERIIGFFIQSLVLRTHLEGNPSVHDALHRVRQTVLDAFNNADIPVDSIVERLGLPRNPAYSPLVQVAFQLMEQNALEVREIVPEGAIGDLSLEVVGGNQATSKFDLMLTLTHTGQQLGATLEYNTDLFNEDTMQRLLRHYEYLLQQIVDDLQRPINQLQIVAPDELYELLNLSRDEVDLKRLSPMLRDMWTR